MKPAITAPSRSPASSCPYAGHESGVRKRCVAGGEHLVGQSRPAAGPHHQTANVAAAHAYRRQQVSDPLRRSTNA